MKRLWQQAVQLEFGTDHINNCDDDDQWHELFIRRWYTSRRTSFVTGYNYSRTYHVPINAVLPEATELVLMHWLFIICNNSSLEDVSL